MLYFIIINYVYSFLVLWDVSGQCCRHVTVAVYAGIDGREETAQRKNWSYCGIPKRAGRKKRG